MKNMKPGHGGPRRLLTVALAALMALLPLWGGAGVWAADSNAGMTAGPLREDESQEVVTRSAARAGGSDVSGRIELTYLSVGGTDENNNDIAVYEYDIDNGVVASPDNITLAKGSALQFRLEWRAKDRQSFSENDHFRIPIMRSNDIDYDTSDNGYIYLDPDGNSGLVLGSYRFVDEGDLLYIHVILNHNVEGPDWLETGYANGNGYASAKSDIDLMSVIFREQDRYNIALKQSTGGAGQGSGYAPAINLVKLESEERTGASWQLSVNEFNALRGLPNIAFEIYEADNDTAPLEFYRTGRGYEHTASQPSGSSGPYTELVTGNEGTLNIYFIDLTDQELDSGKTYYLKEISSEAGYYTGQNQRLTVTLNNSNKQQYGAVYNQYRTVRLIKTDSSNARALAGVEFELYRENTKITGFTRLSDGVYRLDASGGDRLLTGQSGNLEVRYLTAGSYHFVEITPLPGYLANDTEYAFTLEESTGAAIMIPVKNTPISTGRTPSTGSTGGNGGEYRERGADSGATSTFIPTFQDETETEIPETEIPLGELPNDTPGGDDNPQTGFRTGIAVALALVVMTGAAGAHIMALKRK